MLQAPTLRTNVGASAETRHRQNLNVTKPHLRRGLLPLNLSRCFEHLGGLCHALRQR